MQSQRPALKKNKQRHYFFLNPYESEAFTKCPKCDQKTKVRRIPLVIHLEPAQLVTLNKGCRYCPYCDLIIAKRIEGENLMANAFEAINPEIIGNNYVVIGTADRKDWLASRKGLIPSSGFIDRVYLFKDLLNFEVIPAGWYPADKPAKIKSR